jgi:hypothetical protein
MSLLLPKIKWIEAGRMPSESGMIFGIDIDNPGFEGGNPSGHVEIFDDPNQADLARHERMLFIAADVKHMIPDGGNKVSYKLKDFVRHDKGRQSQGHARYVWQFIGADSDLPFRAGLTIHKAKGTWSSLPHDFEALYMQSPKPMGFDEKFYFMTKPRQEWGVVLRTGHLTFKNNGLGGTFSELVNDIVVVRDGDNLQIPLGSHPVSGGPGVTMAYFWAYACDDLSLMEKFED